MIITFDPLTPAAAFALVLLGIALALVGGLAIETVWRWYGGRR